MSQHAARRPAAPAQQRTAQQTMEVAVVQMAEDFVQIVAGAARIGQKFAPADLPHQVHFAAHILAVQVQAVAMRIDPRHWIGGTACPAG